MMKKRAVLLVLSSVIFSIGVSASAGETARDRFERLQSLVGEWRGKSREGSPIHASYELFSNGSALVEVLEAEDHPSMVTVYHLDGGTLLMTHYCGAGNQPRMRIEENTEDSGIFSFTFFDATNLSNLSDGHMHRLELTIGADDQLQQVWTWREGDEEKTEIFQFERSN